MLVYNPPRKSEYSSVLGYYAYRGAKYREALLDHLVCRQCVYRTILCSSVHVNGKSLHKEGATGSTGLRDPLLVHSQNEPVVAWRGADCVFDLLWQYPRKPFHFGAIFVQPRYSKHDQTFDYVWSCDSCEGKLFSGQRLLLSGGSAPWLAVALGMFGNLPGMVVGRSALSGPQCEPTTRRRPFLGPSHTPRRLDLELSGMIDTSHIPKQSKHFQKRSTHQIFLTTSDLLPSPNIEPPSSSPAARPFSQDGRGLAGGNWIVRNSPEGGSWCQRPQLGPPSRCPFAVSFFWGRVPLLK